MPCHTVCKMHFWIWKTALPNFPRYRTVDFGKYRKYHTTENSRFYSTGKAEIFGGVTFSVFSKIGAAVRWREIFGKTRFPGKCTSTTHIQYREYRTFRCVLFLVKINGAEVTENRTPPKISAFTVGDFVVQKSVIPANTPTRTHRQFTLAAAPGI